MTRKYTPQQIARRRRLKRESYKRNKEHVLKYQREHYTNNREKAIKRVRAWEKLNPKKKRAYHTKAQKKLRLKDALEKVKLEAARIADEVKRRGYYIIPLKKHASKKEKKWYEPGYF